MTPIGWRLRDLAQLVARRLRDKLLILLELRERLQIAHACMRARPLHVMPKLPMLFSSSCATQARSNTYRATSAQLPRNHLISCATQKKEGVL
jgi:hypothetical protein